MSTLNRIVLVRHGETLGQSSVRYYGRTDVGLSDRGREQARQAALALPGDAFPLVLTSPLARAWQSARIVAPRSRMLLLDELREVDFGEWEGLTAEEIRARDPIRYEDWKRRGPGFAYPGGEPVADFQARVDRAVSCMAASGLSSILVVGHKGVIRAIVRGLTKLELPPERPALGSVLQLTRDAAGRWFVGRRGNPLDPNFQS
jgi:broad specificity phosphatase PhoE